MGDSDRRLGKLSDVLQNHFSSLSQIEARACADDLLRSMSVSGALENLDRANLSPHDDQKNIEIAAKALAKAQKHLSLVGWHGQKTFVPVLGPFLDEADFLFLANSGARHLAREALLDRVGKLADGLANAVARVDLDGAPVTTAFGVGPEFEKFRTAKPKKSQARFFALECAKVYYGLAGEKPTVRTDAYSSGNAAYGPFLDLVADAFRAVGIGASAETWARQAAKDFSSKK